MAGHASSTTWGTHLLAYASRNHAPPPCIESHPLYYNLCHATLALLTCKCILSWVVWRYFSRSTNCGEEENQSFIQYFCLFAWLHNLLDLFSSAATTDRKHIWSSFQDPLWLNNGILATIKPSGSSSSHLQESLSVTTVTILSKLCKSEVELDFQSFQLIRFRTEGNVLVSNQVLIIVDRMMRMRIILLQYFLYSFNIK